LALSEAIVLAQVLGAPADPVRLQLLSLVASRDEICSCGLEIPLGKSQPTVSHHTKVLAEAGLLVGEKRGRWICPGESNPPAWPRYATPSGASGQTPPTLSHALEED
jgi:DNA-binding transcriptional ArsR family regulator